jgi:hypothetical protein
LTAKHFGPPQPGGGGGGVTVVVTETLLLLTLGSAVAAATCAEFVSVVPNDGAFPLIVMLGWAPTGALALVHVIIPLANEQLQPDAGATVTAERPTGNVSFISTDAAESDPALVTLTS